MEVSDSDKHSKLLRHLINKGRIKVYDTGPDNNIRSLGQRVISNLGQGYLKHSVTKWAFCLVTRDHIHNTLFSL
jgi:hypothetical protein